MSRTLTYLSESWHKNDSHMQEYQCKCQHNTCGPLCDRCCPVFNQKRWRPGKFVTGNECERCQCFGHADECFFDPQVEFPSPYNCTICDY